MTTPRFRSLVSLAAALTLTIAAGGCASAPPHVSDAPAPAEGPPPVVRFDNDSRDYVQVYLVSDLREWKLARVAPGARAMLRIPDDALTEDAGRMRLAVLPGERSTFRAANDRNATSALARPIAEVLSQRWTFTRTSTQGQLTPLPFGHGRPEAGRQ